MGYFDDIDEVSVPESKNSGGYFSDIKEKPSKTRSALSAPVRGLIQGAESFRKLTPFGLTSPIPKEYGEKLAEEFLPVLEEHQPIQRAAKIATQASILPQSLPALALEVAAGTAGGELAKAAGLGETGQEISEAASMGLLGIGRGLSKLGKSLFKGEAEKLPSGLTKIRAIDQPGKLAKITEARRHSVIKNLDKEVSGLTKKAIEKHVPISKKIEQGFDFEKNFERNFGNLRKSAQKYNPEIDISPLNKFLRESSAKFKGIPRPHAEALKIIRDSSAFRRNPKNDLADLLNIYRSNNKKLSSLYETKFAKGAQTEYADFLRGMNREIAKSFEETLPKDSAWMNQFKKMNMDYKAYKDAKSTMHNLKGFLSETPKYSEIEKLATDTKVQENLARKMGEEGAKEVTQIAQDWSLSRSVLKNMKKGEFTKFDLAFPLYYLIPGVGKAAGVLHGIKSGRNLYGHFLSSPSTRSSYQEALSSFLNKDLEGYKKATTKILSNLNQENEIED